jgi:2-dehydropantoate 2-reductase
MRFLFLGAGATGGYFGSQLAKAGVDVTFLVRPKRRDQLARDGLKIESAEGRVTIPVKAITREEISVPFDLIVLSSKAYDLGNAIDTIRPAVGKNSLVLPILNGLKHLDHLDEAFGAERVLGGTCHISATLGDDGTIHKFSAFSSITQGARFPHQKAASDKLHEVLARGFEARHPDDIMGAMWEKWIFIAALAASTCLMRATVGEIMHTDQGPKFMTDVLDECVAVATANGHPPRVEALSPVQVLLTDPKSTFAASMLRDIERGSRIEADQIVGDMISRGRAHGVSTPLLETAYIQLQAYQNRIAASAPAAG